MNAQDLLHFIIAHSEMLIGITIGLALVTLIFILLMPSHESVAGNVDLSQIEDSLKRVLEKIPQIQSQGQVASAATTNSVQDDEQINAAVNAVVDSERRQSETSTTNAATASETSSPASSAGFAGASSTGDASPGVDPVVIEKLRSEVGEREKKIKNLESDLAEMQTKLANAKTSAPGGTADTDALAKIQELQSKLSEYAIIEEELADISKYKDENTKMRQEIENLKANSAAVSHSVAIDPAVVNGSPDVSTATAIAEPAVPVAAEPDSVIRDFQAAVDNQAVPSAALKNDLATGIPVTEGVNMTAPAVPPTETIAPAAESDSPLAGTLDTSKMLEEIEKLGDEQASDEDPMTSTLDTEKLLAEVRELGSPKNPNANPEQTAVDDLMSEFEAEQQQIKAKA